MSPEDQILALLKDWAPEIQRLLDQAGYWDLPRTSTKRQEIAKKIGLQPGGKTYDRVLKASLEKNENISQIVLNEYSLREFKSGAREVAKQLNIPFSKYDWNEGAQEHFEKHGLQLVTQMSQTDIDSLRDRIQYDFNLNPRDFAKKFAESYSCSPARLERIKRTEAHTESQAGGHNFAELAGAETKIWNCHPRAIWPRPSHRAIWHEEVPIDKPFSNGLMWPSEPNCRCYLTYGFGDGTAKPKARKVGGSAPEARKVAPMEEVKRLVSGIEYKPLTRRPLSIERASMLEQAHADVLKSKAKLKTFDVKMDALGARFEAATGTKQEELQVELMKLAEKRRSLSDALSESNLKVDRIKLSQVVSRGYDLSGYKMDGDIVDVSVHELNNGLRIIVNKEVSNKPIYNPASLFRKYDEMPDLLKSGIDEIRVLGRDAKNPGWGLQGADASHGVDERGKHQVTLYRPSGIGVFKHEAAHGLEHKMPRIDGKQFSDSPLWLDAQKADGKYPSRYAKEGGNWEDFADSVDIFFSMPDKFRASCPNRAKVIEALFND